ncbi:MAG: hypothetical protein ACRBB6_16735 [Neptuniibacter sp.]
MQRSKLLIAFLVILLQGCGYNYKSSPDSWLLQYGLPSDVRPDSLTLCTSFGCSKKQKTSISAAELQRIHQLFIPPAPSAVIEREQIANAIAMLEAQQGPKLGTENDLAKNEFNFLKPNNQLDCIAETSNTSVYLLLLSDLDLLRFHKVTGNAHRGPFSFNFPHNSAVILEPSANQAYVVDSWYSKNGERPWITTVENWLSGAHP